MRFEHEFQCIQEAGWVRRIRGSSRAVSNHMSLHQSFKQNQGQKETCLATVPSTADLSYAYNTALKTKRKPIILSWKSPGNPTTFYLTVICNDPNSELPDWHLQKCDEGASRRDIWQHSSADTTLIRELVLAEEQSSAINNLSVPGIPDLPGISAAASFAEGWGAASAPEDTAPLDPASWAANRAANQSANAAAPPPAVMSLPPIESPFPGGGLLKAPQQHVVAREPAPTSPALDSGQYPAQAMHTQPLDISGQHRAQPLNAPPPMNLSTPEAVAPQRELPPPVELDRSLVDGVMRSLSNLETGLLTHQSFLFFLVREFTQFKVSQLPFSLIIAEFFINTPTNGIVALPPAYKRLSAHCLLAAARPLDLAAHYEQNEFALLLPNTPRADALALASRVVEASKKAPMPPEMSASSLVVCLGLSTFPTDSTHPGVCLAAAIEAKNEAKSSGSPLVVFGAQ